MSDVIRYGVFKIADRWSLVSENGATLGFPSRDGALEAAEAMETLHRVFGLDVEVHIQDELLEVRYGGLRAHPGAYETRRTQLTLHHDGGGSA